MDFITITAIDAHSSETRGLTFSVQNSTEFKKSVEDWEKELPYRRYSLITEDYIEDYSKEIIKILDNLEVEY